MENQWKSYQNYPTIHLGAPLRFQVCLNMWWWMSYQRSTVVALQLPPLPGKKDGRCRTRWSMFCHQVKMTRPDLLVDPVGIGIFNSLWNVARFFNISTKKRTTRAPQAETCLVIGSCGYLENIPKHILVDFLKLGQSQQYFPCRKMAGLIHGAPWLRDRHTKYILCCKAGLSKVGC